VDYHVKEPPVRPSSSDKWFWSYLPWALSGGLSTPLIPLVALALYQNVTPLLVAVVVAASALTEIPFTIVWGNLSDKVRHRKFFMVGSFLATGTVLVVMPFVATLGSFVLLNIIEGVCSAASTPIGTVLLLETRKKKWWARDVGVFGLVSGIGTVMGLALGAIWLYSLGAAGGIMVVHALQSLLVLTGVLALVSGLLAWSFIEEPKEYLKRDDLVDQVVINRGVVERLRGVSRRVLNIVELAKGDDSPMPRAEWIFLISLFTVSMGSQMFYGTFVYFLTAASGAGLNQVAVFVVFLAAAVASTALFVHSGKAVDKYSPKRVFILSMIGRALLIPLVIVSTLYLGRNTIAMVAVMITLNGLIGVTWAFASTASTLFLLRLLSGNANRGKAIGYYNALSGFGGLVGTFVGGALYDVSNMTWAYTLAAFVVFLGCLMLVPIRYHFTPYRHVPLPLPEKGASPQERGKGVTPWPIPPAHRTASVSAARSKGSPGTSPSSCRTIP
jgi:MFS family permease